MNWNHQTVLVTGAGGFIGSHLTEQLATLGARTRAFVRYNSSNSWGWLDESQVRNDVKIILGDVRDPDSLSEAARGVDIVFHLAALIAIPYSYHTPLSYVRTNVEGTVNVLQAALKGGVGLTVHTSTSEVYGTAQYVPIDEKHPLQGQSPYSASKIGSDKLVESFHLSFGLPVTTIRPFNTYGPRQSARAIIPTIITQALTQTEIHLGSLEPTRDFNFVSDVVRGFVKIAECSEAVGKVINIGSGKEISVGNMALTILDLVGKDLPIVSESERVRPESSEVERLCANNRQAKDILSWRPECSLRNGLAETIRWIENNVGRYRPSLYTI